MTTRNTNLTHALASTLRLSPGAQARDLSPKLWQQLVHELQLYHVEIECKNAELQRTQDQAEIHHQRYLTFYEDAPLGFLEVDARGLIQSINRTGAELLGGTKAKILGKRLGSFIAATHEGHFHTHKKNALSTHTQQTCELQLQTKDGKTRYARLTSTAMVDSSDQVTGIRITMADTTALRHFQRHACKHSLEAPQQNRLSLCSKLISSIAHEVSQPLTAIVNYANGALRRIKNTEDPSSIVHVLPRILHQAERANNVMLHFNNFLKKGELRKSVIDIHALIQETLHTIEPTIDETCVSIQGDYDNNTKNVHVDPIHIGQVLLNIITNAIEAMANIPPHKRQLALKTTQRSKSTVTIQICNQGPAIPKAILQQIFNPAFTTKPEGMGMGLAIAKSIVEAHGGQLTVTSNTRKTQFNLLLPTAA